MRTDKKVKDIVEVRAYSALSDYLSDPAKTLLAYLFTDATAEMMSKWLDRISEVSVQSGAAKALAGYRGVGKSHFLAALSAILSQPDLRAQITEPLVLFSAQRLKRRRHLVAHVRRGTNENILEELKDALAITLEVDRDSLGDSPEEMLKLAASKAGDLPFVIIVDTALERVARVTRNDGPFLGSLAEIAKNLNIFIGLALDDDIAGADGVNVAIARTYSIDYLDQDHLYRIINTYVFPKNPQELHSLKEVYDYFRKALPGFHWSEQKFTYLYPLHPLILEITPFVRLYIKEFALMGFASEAGTKILGRPANSLICLDEVFDKVELSLRKSDELREAFEAFDRINNEVINQIPVIQRLQAKLVLKTLLLLSLNGEGATDDEVSAATLIFDEDGPEDPSRPVREILQRFAEALPNEINRIVEKSGQIRYSFRVTERDNLNQALREAALGISSDVIPKILRRFASERFSDWVLLTENEVFDSVDCNVIWRGGIRRGRVIWDWYETLGFEPSMRVGSYDWEVIITKPEREIPVATTEEDYVLRVYWRPAQLRPDEVEAMLRYHVLLTDTWLQEEFGDQITIARHALITTVGKIWERIFLEEGELIIDGEACRFTDAAKNSRSLNVTFTEMITPAFEVHYPEHPVFGEVLGINEVSALVSSFFGSRQVNSPETQALAVNFAEPLGLVTMRGDLLVPCSQEDLLHLPTVQKIISFFSETDQEVVPLREIYYLLRREPYGLGRESVQLLLSALVAKRRLEFITSQGDRINWRSLDLKIIWDDIVGVARSEVISYSSAELIEWVKTLTSAEDFHTLDDPQDRERIYGALTNWLKDWKATQVLERFGKLPEDSLNTKVWRLATNANKTFGFVANSIEEAINDVISLEECLQRIADAFSNSEKVFIERTKDLVKLEDFLNGADLRNKAWEYLALCEITQDETVEQLRRELLDAMNQMTASPSEALNREFEKLWNNFREKYAEYFAIRHDQIMRNAELQDKVEEVIRSREWWEFETLSRFPIFPKSYYRDAKELYEIAKQLNCRIDVREMLKNHPVCACSFRLSQMEVWRELPEKLTEVMEKGRKSYRRILTVLRATILPFLESMMKTVKKDDEKEVLLGLIDIFKTGKPIPLLSAKEIMLIEKAVNSIQSSPMLKIEFLDEDGYLTREEWKQRLREWINEMPKEPVLIKLESSI
jgi:hypothetical protein